jgi:hypothetical protein
MPRRLKKVTSPAESRERQDRTEKAVARRIDALDAEPPTDFEWPHEAGPVDARQGSLIGHFVAVMSTWTEAVVEIEAGRGAAITPAAADALARGSLVLTCIEQVESSLVTGPMDRTAQTWTPIGPSAYTGEPPSLRRFVAPQVDQPPLVKPAGAGLYTSTACVEQVSMWRASLGPGGSAARPLPRYTWSVTFDGPLAVAEITSATDWAEFVSAHPRHVGPMIYPDWVDVARSFDAVHITLPTIAAAQGFALITADGMIAPAFWDVETTFWLTWRVSSAQMVEGHTPRP